VAKLLAAAKGELQRDAVAAGQDDVGEDHVDANAAGLAERFAGAGGGQRRPPFHPQPFDQDVPEILVALDDQHGGHERTLAFSRSATPSS
jgi:hypothetical protein